MRMNRSAIIMIAAIVSFVVSCGAGLAMELDIKFDIESTLLNDTSVFYFVQKLRNWQRVQFAASVLSFALVFIALFSAKKK